MKIHHILCGLVVMVGCFASGAPAQAYLSNAQSAHTFNATTTLFAIAYSFGSASKDLDLPVLTGRDIPATRNDILGYTLLDKSGTTVTTGTMRGIVVSNAPIVNGRYHVAAGKAATFTFITFLTTPVTKTPSSYQVRVTSLPFTITDHGKAYENHLNPSELQYYTTPASLLKPGRIVHKEIGKGVSVNYTTK
jgi:hypothetical protein